MQRVLFKDVIVACGNQGRCFVRNDGPLAGLDGVVQLSLVSLKSGAATTIGPLSGISFSLSPGPAAIFWFCSDGSVHIVLFLVLASFCVLFRLFHFYFSRIICTRTRSCLYLDVPRGPACCRRQDVALTEATAF
jgi:hypothetical protein